MQARLRSSNIPEWVKVVVVPILGIFLTAGTTWYISSIQARQEERAKEVTALRESFSKHLESLATLIAEAGPWEKWSAPQKLLGQTH
jgi:Tfp pilus assembly protein PilO